MRVSFEDSLKGLADDGAGRRSSSPATPATAPAPRPARRRSAARSATARGVVATSQGLFALQQPCPRCRGNGTIVETPCPTCHGSGRERRTKRYTVRIPAGVKDGTKIKLKGKGEAGWGGAPAGDLFVVTRVEPSKLYERRGDDLVLEVPVTFDEAALGATVEIPTPGRPRLAEGPGRLAGREAAARQGPRRAEAEGRRPRRPARARCAIAGAGEADEGASARRSRTSRRHRRPNPREQAVRMMDEPARSGATRPALHDLRRRRARRHAPADAADLRAEGPRAAEAHRRQHAALLRRRRRAAAADPAADDRDRPQPRRRRAVLAPRGRARSGCAAGSTGWSARCARRSTQVHRQYRRDLVLYRPAAATRVDADRTTRARRWTSTS